MLGNILRGDLARSWRLAWALVLGLGLLGGSAAWALTCPAPEEVKIADGWWSAPEGWQQDRTYQKPSAAAHIVDFAAASFQGNLKGPGKMLCLYVVKGQPGAEFTKLLHPSSGGPMDFNWDCPPDTTGITCSCVSLRRTDCEVRD